MCIRDSLEGLQSLGVGQVGSDAHIYIFALLEEAELGLVSQICHVLHLVAVSYTHLDVYKRQAPERRLPASARH